MRSNPEQELIGREHKGARISLKIMLKQVLMTGLERRPDAGPYRKEIMTRPVRSPRRARQTR